MRCCAEFSVQVTRTFLTTVQKVMSLDYVSGQLDKEQIRPRKARSSGKFPCRMALSFDSRLLSVKTRFLG